MKQRNGIVKLFSLVFFLGFLLSLWLAHDLYQEVSSRKSIKEDYAEINRVNYELFNIQLWKEEALAVFQERIRSFQISEKTYDALGGQINIYLKKLYKQYFESGELIDIIIKNLEQNGNINKMFLNIIKTNLGDQLDQLNLEGQIPVFGDQILSEIKESEPFLRTYLQQELLRLVVDDASQIYFDRRRMIFQKYGFGDVQSTDTYLENKIRSMSVAISKNIKIFSALLLFLIISVLFCKKFVGFRPVIISLSLISILLLVLGISMPMIDIDARLNSFSFDLLGSPIHFDEQIIYYQSKSILEVTKTLWQGRGLDLKLVGVLVFLFSVVFPFTKLILSSLFLFFTRIRDSKVAETIIFHLGKWSMADVFVVAMFMAYIGFYGILSSQLSALSNNQSGFAIETVNYSQLSPGAFFFTAYTILSIFISIMINKNQTIKGAGVK